jgi:hypothetical protein
MKKVFFSLLAVVMLIMACTKENNIPPIQAQTYEVNSSSSTTWKYFSFEINDTVTVSDPSASTVWDLAFQRYRIKTNGGKSGNGLGSAANSYKKGQTGFDALKFVPDTATFATDDSVKIAVQQGYATYIVNPKVYSWFTIELAAQGTQIVPTDNVYIVKTATGKYAKVWFKSYYSATNVSGHVSFMYKYQPDGSKILE